MQLEWSSITDSDTLVRGVQLLFPQTVKPEKCLTQRASGGWTDRHWIGEACQKQRVMTEGRKNTINREPATALGVLIKIKTFIKTN